MQAIFEDEDEGGDSGRTSSIGLLIHTGRIRHMERKRNRGIGNRRDGI